MSGLIESVKSPKDIKNFKPKELIQLASEIRGKIIETVSETGSSGSKSWRGRIGYRPSLCLRFPSG